MHGFPTPAFIRPRAVPFLCCSRCSLLRVTAVNSLRESLGFQVRAAGSRRRGWQCRWRRGTRTLHRGLQVKPSYRAAQSREYPDLKSLSLCVLLSDHCLSLLDTNLPAEAETELRSFISKRLTKGALFEGMGNVASVALSIPEGKVGCYYCRFQQESLLEMATLESDINAPEYVVCFLGGSEKGLELFRLELDKYIQNLKRNLDLEQKNLEACVSPYLRSWFEDAICPIQRVVQLFQDKLASLLHAALSYTPVEVKNADERTEKDISRFLAAASLQGLVQEGTMTSLCIAMTEEQHKSMVIDCSGPQPQLHNAGSNRFCEDWMQAFVNGAEGGNPFLFRQILENFKLKAIQDINNLKRFIRQAEMNHYALFKCYLFLKNCGSGDILLKIVKVEHAEMPEARNVVTVLEEFMRETSVA